MLPVVKITGANQQALLLYVAVLGVLLLIASLIRLKVVFLKKAFIPASLLAGILGLVLGPHVLKVIPADMMTTIGGLPGNMIVIVFSVMLLGVKKAEPLGSSLKTLVPGILQFYVYSFSQVGLACLLGVFLFTPLFGTNPMFGSTFEVGFLGGHGTAGGMVEVFNLLGWPDGGDVGKTTATIGLMAGILGGMILINYGVRKRYTRLLTTRTVMNEAQEVYREGERKAGAYVTISHDVVETFAFHAGLISVAILLGWLMVWGAKTAFAYSLPLFPFAMIGGWLLNGVIQRTSIADMVDRNVLSRIQGLALEILVVSAVASVSVPVVVAYWKPLLIGSVIILVSTVFIFLWVSPRFFPHDWFEHGIVRYGAATGVAAIGFMLLRVCDPEMETDAGSVYALCSPFMSPFVGGGLITTAYPALILKWGALPCGVIFTLLSIALVLFCRISGFWVANPKLEQR